VYYAESWWAIVFNPSFPYRFAHMVLAAYLATCFAIAGVAARYLLENRFPRRAGLMLRLAVIFASVVVPLQIVLGDLHGLNTQEYQPAKIAAIEAHWESRTHAPLLLFAWPDETSERNLYEIGIPSLGSWILKHDPAGRVTGLQEFPPDERPPVAWVFFMFRLMVGIGLVMLVLAWSGLAQWLRGRLEFSTTLLRGFRLAAPLGFVGILAGWITTEVGRQPYLVHGLMRTSEGVSAVPAGSVAGSLVLFLLVYAGVFGAGTYYVLRLIRQGPLDVEPRDHPAGTAMRPLSVPPESLEEST
jgi:cytochrome d ubiquinol oxidase subunit I